MIYVIGVLIIIIILLCGYLFFKYSKLKDINNSLEIAKENINIVEEKNKNNELLNQKRKNTKTILHKVEEMLVEVKNNVYQLQEQ